MGRPIAPSPMKPSSMPTVCPGVAASFGRMPIGVRLEPEHLTAPAGADIEGAIVLDNPSSDAVHVRVVISSEVAGWASVEPGDVWVPATADKTVALRFRLPRGAPGGVGAI